MGYGRPLAGCQRIGSAAAGSAPFRTTRPRARPEPRSSASSRCPVLVASQGNDHRRRPTHCPGQQARHDPSAGPQQPGAARVGTHHRPAPGRNRPAGRCLWTTPVLSFLCIPLNPVTPSTSRRLRFPGPTRIHVTIRRAGPDPGPDAKIFDCLGPDTTFAGDTVPASIGEKATQKGPTGWCAATNPGRGRGPSGAPPPGQPTPSAKPASPLPNPGSPRPRSATQVVSTPRRHFRAGRPDVTPRLFRSPAATWGRRIYLEIGHHAICPGDWGRRKPVREWARAGGTASITAGPAVAAHPGPD